MKHIIIITIITFFSSTLVSAQNDKDSLSIGNPITSTTQEDSIEKIYKTLNYLADDLSSSRSNDFFKIYPTENTHILLKLDTSDGRVWMVQYRMKETQAMTVAIDATSLLSSWSKHVPGRFELYPTKNIYTFILLDKLMGYTYQVQWGTDDDHRFRELIY